jgi:hypothetical protein
MMELPINQKELDIIIKLLKYSHPDLYAKLWSFNINRKK